MPYRRTLRVMPRRRRMMRRTRYRPSYKPGFTRASSKFAKH